jgi:hypothetical protein
MTDQEINKSIAEVCGWTNVNPAHRSGKVPGTDYTSNYEHIPNYCTDLNAMNEAEKALTSMQQDEYWDFLWDLTGSEFELCHANARQRAEAFLKTVGKWEE